MIGIFLKRGGALAAIFLLAGLGALALGVSEIGVGRAMRGAETLEATVTGLEERRGYSHANNTFTTDLVVTVTYPGGRAEETVSEGFYDSLSEGQTLPIRRLAGPPERIEIEPGSVSWNALAFLIIAAACLAFGGWLIRHVLRAIRRTQHLLAEGREVRGEVVERVANAIIGDKLKMAFDPGEGTRREVVMAIPAAKDFGPLDAGSLLTLVHDRADPDQVAFKAELERLAR